MMITSSGLFASAEPYESKYIKIWRAEKENFIEKLRMLKSSEQLKVKGLHGLPYHHFHLYALGKKQLNGVRKIPFKPSQDHPRCYCFDFFKYNFYIKYHETEPDLNLELLQEKPEILKRCKKELFYNYSAIAPALLAPDVTLEQKRVYIKKLLKLGFAPTRKDCLLAYLELYERTKEDSERKFALVVGHLDKNCILSKLPLEIIMHIGDFITTEKALIPKKYFIKHAVKSYITQDRQEECLEK